MEKIEKAARWTCEGSVRGSCGRNHRTRESAAQHCERDQASCAGIAGGKAYSDRFVEAANDEAELVDALNIRDLAAVCRALAAAGVTSPCYNYPQHLDDALLALGMARVAQIIDEN